MIKYDLKTTARFDRKLKKIYKSFGLKMRKVFIEVFEKLSDNPFERSLHTHKVTVTEFGFVYSSRVTKDYRILWEFKGEKIKVLLLLDVGGHSGKRSVYR